jgi:hypothetical protein
MLKLRVLRLELIQLLQGFFAATDDIYQTLSLGRAAPRYNWRLIVNNQLELSECRMQGK